MALSVISLLSGASSAIGTTLSLPKLMGAASEQLTVTYGVGDYALLGVVILLYSAAADYLDFHRFRLCQVGQGGIRLM